MDLKKSRQQYRLKGATKIMSEQPTDEPSKTNHQEANVDSTTTSSAIFADPSMAIACVTTTNNSQDDVGLIRSNSQVQQHSHHRGQIQSSSAANLVYMTSASENCAAASTSNSTSNSTSSTSSASMAAPSYNWPSHNPLAIQQQPFRTQQPILPSDIGSLFECPICFDFAVPPIYQCQNGHLVCQSCSAMITHCPTCRVPVSEPSIRNLQLDRLANTFQFPCKYDFNGCKWKSYWYKKREHEEDCEFISYSCPCPGTACKWTGLLSEVMPHLSEHHKSITTLNGEDIVFLATDINLKGAVDWVMIQSCFNHHFLLVLEKQELKTGQQQFFAVVQLIGSQKEASKFKYKLELGSNVPGQAKRLQWEATPRSILDGIQVAISTYDCLVFDARMAQHFLSPIHKDKDANGQSASDNQGENLGINVTIDCLV